MGMCVWRSWGGVGAAAVVLSAFSGARAQTVPPDFSVSTLTSVARPTAMTVAPDGSVYITQQAGALRVWRSGESASTVATFTVDSGGERGLIGVALDPAFPTNRYVCLHYTVPTVIGTPVHNSIRRITLDATGTTMVAGSEVVIFDMDALTSASNHNGGAIHFGLDGKLYAGVGDNANSANAQSITTVKGKLLRLNADPGDPIPSNNPASIAGIMGTTSGRYRAIWAAGLRNPFTFAVHPRTGRIFIDDVGAGTWEEIDDAMAGANYGWGITEGRFDQAMYPNFTEPLVAYRHTNPATNYPPGIGSFTGNVITDGAFYVPYADASPNFPVSYSEQYFFGDAGAGFVRTFDPAANTGAAFGSTFPGVVGIELARDNTLLCLIGSGSSTGALLRITYTGFSGVCCTGTACTTSNGLGCPPSSFVWGVTSCSPTACCRADFNHSGATNIQDIFDYLAAWFAGDPRTDINGTGGITVQDIFDFLAAWFAGC